MISLHSNKLVTKTEVGIKDWAFAVTGLTMLFVGGILNTLGHWSRKAVVHFLLQYRLESTQWDIGVEKQLMSHPMRGTEDSVTESSLNYGGPDQEVSEEEISNKWSRDHYDILAKMWLLTALI